MIIDHHDLSDKISSKVKEILDIREELDEDRELVELGLNSLQSIRLIVELERMFDIEFSEDELDFEHFNTLEKISKKIRNKLE